jgi:HEAT repeat protein
LVQVAAAKALAQLETPEAQQALQKLAQQTDDLLVRQAATQNQTASSSEPSAAIETLLETLRHETIGHKRALALYQAGQRAGAQLLPILHALWQTETEPLVRQELIELLAHQPRQGAPH